MKTREVTKANKSYKELKRHREGNSEPKLLKRWLKKQNKIRRIFVYFVALSRQKITQSTKHIKKKWKEKQQQNPSYIRKHIQECRYKNYILTSEKWNEVQVHNNS